MKQVKKQIKSNVSTKSQITVGHKVALSLLMASVFAVGLNFMGMTFSSKRIVFKKENSLTLRANVTPLIVNEITDVSINTSMNVTGGAYNYLTLDFLSGSVAGFGVLGSLNLPFNQYTYQGQVSAPTTPLAVYLSWGSAEGQVIPARIINIEAQDGKYTLCLPETTIMSNLFPTYYYDNNGTPYHDSLLTQMATSKACDELLTNILELADIQSASINVPVDFGGEEYDQPGLQFISNFSEFEALGYLNLTTNEYNYASSTGYQAGAPLAISLFFGDTQARVIPESIINIFEVTGRQIQLCLPETVDSYAFPTYFYDNNGMPYHDSFLMEAEPCNPSGVNITSPLTASTTEGNPFQYNIFATGAPTSFDAIGLAEGLSINTSTGVISGVPTISGIFNITISATNFLGTDTENLILTISPVIAHRCIDSDGGVYKDTRGTVSGMYVTGEPYSVTDVCVDSGVLEYYCDEGIDGPSVSLINCESGCNNGACVNGQLNANIMFR